VHALLAGKPIETFSFTQSLRFGGIGTQVVRVDDLLGFLGIHTAEIDALFSEALSSGEASQLPAARVVQ
jgi:hypothetical protein